MLKYNNSNDKVPINFGAPGTEDREPVAYYTSKTGYQPPDPYTTSSGPAVREWLRTLSDDWLIYIHDQVRAILHQERGVTP